LCVGKRVDKGLGAGGIHVGLVGDPNNEKLRAVLIEEFGALENTRSASRANSSRKRGRTLMETVWRVEPPRTRAGTRASAASANDTGENFMMPIIALSPTDRFGS
jgi:hypothetical protein